MIIKSQTYYLDIATVDMNIFCLVLTVVIRLVIVHCRQGYDNQYIVTIYNKHTGTEAFPLCAGVLLTKICVITTRFCLPHHAYKIRYGNIHTLFNAHYSKILRRQYHKNSHPALMTNNRMNKHVVSGSNNIALALVEQVLINKLVRLLAVDYKTIVGQKVEYCSFNLQLQQKLINDNTEKPAPILDNETAMRGNNKKDLKHVLTRRRKKVREYYARFNETVHRLRKISRVQLLENALPENDTTILFNTGIVAPCYSGMNRGPYICVGIKCINEDSEIIVPDLGTPLTYDNKIIGLAADVDEDILKFTPISPYLSWIYNFIDKNKRPLRRRRKLAVRTEEGNRTVTNLPSIIAL